MVIDLESSDSFVTFFSFVVVLSKAKKGASTSSTKRPRSNLGTKTAKLSKKEEPSSRKKISKSKPKGPPTSSTTPDEIDSSANNPSSSSVGKHPSLSTSTSGIDFEMDSGLPPDSATGSNSASRKKKEVEEGSRRKISSKGGKSSPCCD